MVQAMPLAINGGVMQKKKCAYRHCGKPIEQGKEVKNTLTLIHGAQLKHEERDYLICKTDCIAAVKNPIHNQPVNAVDVQEDKACQSNNVPVRGTATSLRLVEVELDDLLGQRTKGKRRNSMIS